MTRISSPSRAVDVSRSVSFRFDGRRMTGCEGDTLASALLANDVRIVGRSFKYHRPRGIFGSGEEEPNALVTIGSGALAQPNVKATTIELREGLEAWSQNRFPSLRFDLLGLINGIASPLLGAGFYYKTFMWPRAFWEKVYEPAIRKAAGLGRASEQPDPATYEKATVHADVLVVGAGPAGLTAATEAGRAGVSVVLCEGDFLPGGGMLASTSEHRSEALAGMLAVLAQMPNVRLLLRTNVFGAYDHGVFGAVERLSGEANGPRERMWRINAGKVVLATGAVERPMLFDGNDLPGVMLAGAIRTYVERFAVAPGKRIVFYVNNEDGWRTAIACMRAGVVVGAIVDPRERLPADSSALHDIACSLTSVYLGARIERAIGGGQLQAVVMRQSDGTRRRLVADCLGVSGGWNPNIALTTHLGARPQWDARTGQFLAETTGSAMVVTGAAAGLSDLDACIAHGTQAAIHALAGGEFGKDQRDAPAPCPLPLPADLHKGKVFVDLQHDVTTRDVGIAWREGFRAAEHLKRYTTLGMATDQGRTSNFLGLAVMAELTGNGIPSIGTTTHRPPAMPVSIGALAGDHRGRHFRPTRKTATHEWAISRSAPMIEAGLWMRAQFYPREQDADWLETTSREAAAVRSGVGICDVSTLGKIDVQGPDAGRFLDFVYANTFSSLAVGRARYGLMLREDGFVFDDGTTARLASEHYVVSTTTANAETVMEHLEFITQVLRPELDVEITSITEQWAQFAISGPECRTLVSRVLDGSVPLDGEALPHMAVTAVRLWDGTKARLFRLSFSGERGFELAVPASYGLAVWQALLEKGVDLGVCPYGTEALATLRIEKGHVAGPELDGNTTAHDLGLGRMVSKRKDFIGRALAARPALTDPARPSLVGLMPVTPGTRLFAGALLLPEGRAPAAGIDEGRVTSAAWSPERGEWIALGLLSHGPARHGERMVAYDPIRNATTSVTICAPGFVDPEGKRVHG